MLFAEGGDGWVGVVQAVIAMVGTLALAYLAYLQLKLKAAVDTAATSATKAADSAAVKVAEVKVTAEKQDTKLDAIHTLVNSNMAAQLRISAVALRRLSDLTGHPDDVAAAQLAESLFREHEAKQNVVDSKKAT